MNFYPTPIQLTLLKAAILNGNKAVESWNQWKKSWKPGDYLDNGSARLLPLTYKNLLANGLNAEQLLPLEEKYKESLSKTEKLFKRAEIVLDILHASGIKTLVLKGPALCVLHYNDLGVRPMSDIDVLVTHYQARQAIETLLKKGWKPEFPEYLEYNLKLGKSMMFYDTTGFEFDLHWHPFFESHGRHSQDDFFTKAIPLRIGKCDTLALCPAQNLLHTLIHGLRYNPEPPIRWIPDAMTILSSRNLSIDWDDFLIQTKRFKSTLAIRQALLFLKNEFDALIPEAVLTNLYSSRISLSEKLIFNYTNKRPDALPDSFFPRLYYLFVVYMRQSGRKTLLGNICGFFPYLRFRTKGKSWLRITSAYLVTKN